MQLIKVELMIMNNIICKNKNKKNKKNKKKTLKSFFNVLLFLENQHRFFFFLNVFRNYALLFSFLISLALTMVPRFFVLIHHPFVLSPSSIHSFFRVGRLVKKIKREKIIMSTRIHPRNAR